MPGTIAFEESHEIRSASAGLLEPSGLAAAADGNHLWTVSDSGGKIFLVDLKGDLKPNHTIETGFDDLEGIALDPTHGRLLAVSEQSGEIISIPLSGGPFESHPISEMEGYDALDVPLSQPRSNDGLEGIAIDPETSLVYVVKENDPRLLLELSADLTRIVGAETLTANLGFVSDRADDIALDVAGIEFDPVRRALWIVSDTGERIFLYDPKTRSAASWPLVHGRHHVQNAEGIALLDGGTRLAIVTDDGKESRLLIYRLD